MANVNDGHRQRLRERMRKEGLDGFQDHEILELLLFQSIPRQDTNKLAHTLISKFGNLFNVLNAKPEDLMMVDGISEVTACNLSMLKEVWRRCRRAELGKAELNDISKLLQFVRILIAESYSERLVVVYVDRATKYMYSEEYVADGDTHSVNINIVQVVACAVRLQASGILLFHCHTEGSCTPSEDDVNFTERVIHALSGLEIVLLEHLIFNPQGDYYSFFKEGDLERIAEKYNLKIQETRLKE